jgi:hypothetical protein
MPAAGLIAFKKTQAEQDCAEGMCVGITSTAVHRGVADLITLDAQPPSRGNLTTPKNQTEPL